MGRGLQKIPSGASGSALHRQGQVAIFDSAAIQRDSLPQQSLLFPCSSQRNLFCRGIKNSCTRFGFHLQTKTETLSCHRCAISAAQIQCFTKEREERKLYPFPVPSSLPRTRKCLPIWEQMKTLSESSHSDLRITIKNKRLVKCLLYGNLQSNLFCSCPAFYMGIFSKAGIMFNSSLDLQCWAQKWEPSLLNIYGLH